MIKALVKDDSVKALHAAVKRESMIAVLILTGLYSLFGSPRL
jgi:hypothetical protein